MSLCRWICRSRAVGTVRSVRYHSSRAASSSPSSPLPLISLAPAIDGDSKVYKLRSLAADSSVMEVNTRELFGDADADAEVVGLSHRWVALFNKHNSNTLFLSDPLSHRRINLPPYHTLPHPSFTTDLDGHGSVSKVVLSSSPDNDNCCAVMIYGLGKRLAYCFPGCSSEWTPIGNPFRDREADDFPFLRFVRFARVQDDVVYCARWKIFTSISPCHFKYATFQLRDRRSVSRTQFYSFASETCHWDIRKPKFRSTLSIPEPLTASHKDKLEGGATHMWLKTNEDFLQEQCIHIPHIVYAEHSNQQFLVLRYVRLIGVEDGDDIPYCADKGLEEVYECQTYGFIVMEISLGGRFKLLEDLNGMAMFVGMDTSFAIPAEAAAANQLKANSIYFTDAKRNRMLCGVNDNGIFDYQNKTISPFLL